MNPNTELDDGVTDLIFAFQKLNNELKLSTSHLRKYGFFRVTVQIFSKGILEASFNSILLVD